MPLLERATPAGVPAPGAPPAGSPSGGTAGPPAGMPPATAHTHGPVVPEQSRAQRRRSFEVADFPVPTGREEEWRFTPVDRLGPFFAGGADGASGDEASDRAVEHLVEAPEQVHLGALAHGQVPRGRALVPGDRPAAVASAATAEARHVRIPAELVLHEPVRVRVHGPGVGGRSTDHLVLEAQAHSKAVVVLEHTGLADHSGNVEVIVGDGAELTVVSIQDWADGSRHLGQHDALVGRDAAYTHVAVTLGGDIVRLNADVRYAGPGGRATMLGLYFADAGQHLEHRLFVDHEATHCRSHVEYKGALQGDTARTVWVGDVLIRAEAEGTDTYELNRNLLLTDGARADSVPNLEIETGQIVGAGHASATGRFDDEQLFYLQARGIPEAEARRLVVRGFFADIINRIPVADLQGHLTQAVERELARTVTGADLPSDGQER